MPAMSTPTRQMSWRTGRQRVSVLAELAVNKEVVSRRLTELREEHGLSQERAAAKVGVTMRQWQRWEGGQSVPYPRNLEAIADAFEISVVEFFHPASETPDPFTPTQLDRIEAELIKLRTERDDHAKEVAKLLSEQSQLLETIKTLIGTDGDTTLQEHLTQMLLDAAAKAGPGPERSTPPAG